MPRIYFPQQPDEIKETGTTFFAKHKNDGVKSPLLVLMEHNYDAQALEFDKWLALDASAKEHDKLAKQDREKRDKIWNNQLKKPLMDAKDLIISINKQNPAAAEDWGYPTTKKGRAKKASSQPAQSTGTADMPIIGNTPTV